MPKFVRAILSGLAVFLVSLVGGLIMTNLIGYTGDNAEAVEMGIILGCMLSSLAAAACVAGFVLAGE